MKHGTRPILFWDKSGNPIHDVLEWGALHANMDYCLVAVSGYAHRIVLTVWTGLDDTFNAIGRAAFDTESPPLIFATVVIGEAGFEEKRWATLAQAQAGHDQTVAWLKEKLASPES